MRSLSALTAAFLLIFFIATAGAGYAIFSAAEVSMVRLVDERIAVASDLVSGDAGGGAAMRARIARLARSRDTGDIGFELRDDAGVRLGGNVTLARALPLGTRALHPSDNIPGLTAGRALTREVGSGLRLTTIAETDPIEGYGREQVRRYLIGFGSIVMIVLGGTALFAYLIARRIALLRHTAEAIIDGDLARRVAVVPDGGGFARLALTFNRMLDRIDTLMRSIANISNDMAHDLRTPLARLRGRLDALVRVVPADLRPALDAATAECDRILAMFAAMLRIAEIESGARRAGFSTFAVDDLLREIAETLAPAAEEAERTLTLAPLPRVSLLGDRQLVAQAIVNLVENALHHPPVGTRVTIALTPDVVIVSDDGPGIPLAQHTAALRRFGRLDTSRGVAGHGLGLPLVVAIAELHGGSLVLEDARPGLRVLLRFTS